MYKVVIPSAGLGTRIGPYSKFINKALLTIGNQPAITHIIDKFPMDVEIVVLVGYKADYLMQVLRAFYPKRKITFVEVDKYEGEGSGLGYSLLRAEENLQCPFIFVSNDTIVPDDSLDRDPNEFGNWMAYYEVNGDNIDVAAYRTLEVNQRKVTNINPKGSICDHIYIGCAGVVDYELFWDNMHHEKAITVGESWAMKALHNISAVKMQSWCDTGNLESLRSAQEKLDTHEYNILEKEGESIWFTDNRVIKFSTDDSFIADRLKRAEIVDKSLFPQIIASDKNLYVYNKVAGKILSDVITPKIFRELFEIMNKKMWSKRPEEGHEQADAAVCWKFYHDKTYERVDLFLNKFEVLDSEDSINGEVCGTTKSMLDNIIWQDICDRPYMSHFHGDFHNENIILSENCRPVLIDWRQNFTPKNIEFGDAYYDFAKFHHGLIVPHKSVHNNQFTVRRDSNGSVFIDIDRPHRLVEVEKEFMDWLDEHGYDSKKVYLMTALIYLNICGLHEYPYSLFLYYLGKYMLKRATQ